MKSTNNSFFQSSYYAESIYSNNWSIAPWISKQLLEVEKSNNHKTICLNRREVERKRSKRNNSIMKLPIIAAKLLNFCPDV